MKIKQSAETKCKALVQWYQQPLGKRLLDIEQTLLDQVLPDLFGYHLLQLGSPTETDLLRASKIHHRSIIDVSSNAPRISCCSAAEALPIDSDSVDLVVMPHTMEYAEDAHQVLREVDRVLIPEGHAIIMGFNPWSIWGAWRAVAKYRQQFPWNGQFRSIARIKDWCKLLGFDVLDCHHYFYRPPLQRSAIMNRLQFLEGLGDSWQPPFAAGYFLLTQKRESRLTPVCPSWSTPNQFIGAKGLARPAARDNIHYLFPKND